MSFYAAPREAGEIWKEAESRGWWVGASGRTTTTPDRWVIHYWNAPFTERSRATFSGEFEVAGTDDACIQGCTDALRMLEDHLAAHIAESVA